MYCACTSPNFLLSPHVGTWLLSPCHVLKDIYQGVQTNSLQPPHILPYLFFFLYSLHVKNSSLWKLFKDLKKIYLVSALKSFKLDCSLDFTVSRTAIFDSGPANEIFYRACAHTNPACKNVPSVWTNQIAEFFCGKSKHPITSFNYECKSPEQA